MSGPSPAQTAWQYGLQGEQSYSGARAYNQSKLANVLFTYELARRLGLRASLPKRYLRAW